MSVGSLNEFPVHNLTLNITSVQLTVLVVGLIKFMLLQILLHRKRISTFFSGCKSNFCSSHDRENQDSSNKTCNFEPPANQEKKVDDRSVCSGEVGIVLRSLGLFSQEEKLPAGWDAGEMFDIFEERSPSLDEVREAFDVFDSNRDGFIDEKELQKVLCALGLKEGSEMESCTRMIGAFDEDGDGRIDFDEFVKFMENSFF